MANKTIGFLALLVFASMTAGAVEVVNKPYKKAPEPKLVLPFAAAAKATQDSDAHAAGRKEGYVGPLQVREGDRIDEKLKEWLSKNNYSLYWEAPKYQSGGSVMLSGSVESTLKELLQMMQANGISMNAEIFRNNAVRITEVK